MDGQEFIVEIVTEIAEYAREHNYDIDDTIRSMGEWLIALTDISTFEHFKEVDNEQND